MILTYKVKHNRDFARELKIAFKIAQYAINNRDKLSTKYVKHLGLKAAISNQILRKYGRNKNCKTLKSVMLTVPNQAIKTGKDELTITCLKLNVPFQRKFEKINQIEIDKTYAYIAVTVKEKPQIKTKTNIGVDLNTTSHCAVVAIKETGKIYKFGKKAEHIHRKYKSIRKNLQKKGLYKVVKKIRNRESRIVKDLNHKISKAIIKLAIKNKSHVKLEKLKGIRNNKKHRKSFKYALNSWSFYQLQQFLEYKALLAGIPVTYVEPSYTSKACSKCGHLGVRIDKEFKCHSCGHAEHADINAAFNIAFMSKKLVQLQAERDVCKGNTDTPQVATQ